MCAPCKPIIDCQGAAQGAAEAFAATMRLFKHSINETTAIAAEKLAQALEYVSYGLVKGIERGPRDGFDEAEIAEILAYSERVCDMGNEIDEWTDTASKQLEGSTAMFETAGKRQELNRYRTEVLTFARMIAAKAEARRTKHAS